MDAYISRMPKNEEDPAAFAERDEKYKQRRNRNMTLLSELPGRLKLAGNLARHLAQIHAHYKKTGKVKVPDHIAVQRLHICLHCPDGKMVVDKNGVMRCSLQSCGCYLDNPNERKILDGKAYYAALDCDNGHWPKLDPPAIA